MAKQTKPDHTSVKSVSHKEPWPFVNTFALIITLLSAAILIILVLMAWLNIGKATPASDNIKGLFNVLLPLIGTWMGTLLAYYFSKENYEAASKQAQAMALINSGIAKLQDLKVGDVMIKPNDSSLLMVDNLDKFKDQHLTDLIQKMEESHSDRLPVLEKGTLKYIFLIYRTTIDRFIVAAANDSSLRISDKPVKLEAIKELKMADMFNSNFPLFKAILGIDKCFLPVTATLDKVQQAMLDNTICQDVFITQTGDKNEAVLGWITNTMIIEKAELFKKAGPAFN